LVNFAKKSGNPRAARLDRWNTGSLNSHLRASSVRFRRMRHWNGDMMVAQRYGPDARIFRPSKTSADSIRTVLNIMVVKLRLSTSLIPRKPFPVLNLKFDFSISWKRTASVVDHFDQSTISSSHWGSFPPPELWRDEWPRPRLDSSHEYLRQALLFPRKEKQTYSSEFVSCSCTTTYHMRHLPGSLTFRRFWNQFIPMAQTLSQKTD
jgi:hypothetical protein